MSSGARIVICGGGAIGAAIAYFTSRRGAQSAVIEPHTVAGAASGIVGRQTPITPRVAELGGEFGMELEAPPRQPIERAAAAPVERQEAARLASDLS